MNFLGNMPTSLNPNVLTNAESVPDSDQLAEYGIRPYTVLNYIKKLRSISLFEGVKSTSIQYVQKTVRNRQSRELLDKVSGLLKPVESDSWLAARNIDVGNNFISHTRFLDLTEQELLDLFVIPQDHIIDLFGMKKIEGLVFPDVREGKLLGICIRNCSDDKKWVAHAKFTFSNYGLYLYGLDQIDFNREIFLCEGVFDVLAFRKLGFQAIGFGSSSPSAYQLAYIKDHIKYPIICMDNDFYGWCGAYAARQCLKSEIVMSEHEDPAEEVFDFNSSKFNRIKPERLEEMIRLGIPEHNKKMESLDRYKLEEFRNIKYLL